MYYIARFRHTTGRYLIVDGDPNDRHWGNPIGAQKLRPGHRLDEMYRTFSADEITELKTSDRPVIGPLGQPITVGVTALS